MKKTVIWSIALAFILGVVVTAVASNTGPEEMVLKTEKAKKPAKFPHKKHQEMYSCGECHHSMGDDGKQIPYTEGMEIQKCESCHNSSFANKKLNSFKGVGHARCKECHKEAKKEGKDAPTKCNGCHIKGKKKKLEGC